MSNREQWKGLQARASDYGFVRTLIFLVWWAAPLTVRRKIERFIAGVFSFLKVKHIKLKVNRTPFYIDPRSAWAVRVFYILGKYDFDAIAAVRRCVPADYFFLDVGANFGVWTYSLADYFKDVWSIEPNPHCFDYLKKTKEYFHKDNVHLVNAALSERNGSAELFFDKDNLGDNRIYNPKGPAHELQGTVKTLNFDSLLKENNLNAKRMFIKLDTQGSEPWILQGMADYLKSSEDVILYSEVQGEPLAAGGHSVGGYFALLQNLGFRPVDLYSNLKQLEWVQAAELIKNNKDCCFRYQ